MYTKASDNYKTTINGYSRRFAARLLKRDGEILDAEIKSYSLGKYSSTGEDYCIGCAFSSSVTISCITDVSLKDQEVVLETGLHIGSEVEYVPDGVYTIVSAKKKDLVTELTGYDRMYTAGQNAFQTPELPCLLSAAAASAAEQLGCSFDSACLVGVEDLTLETMPAGTLSEIAGYLAGLLGRNAYIDRAGQLTFQAYTDYGYTFDGNRISRMDSDPTARRINWLECTTSDEDILRSGNGSGYARIKNPMMTQEYLDQVTAGIAGFSYYGAEISFLLGDSRLDPWDIIHYQYLATGDALLMDENGYILTDEFGNVFVDLLSDSHQISVCCHEITWKFDGGLSMDINSYALSESEENTNFRGPMQAQVDQANRTAAEADKKAEEAKKQLSRYEMSVDAMNQLAANALGYYETVKADADGSKITYMHNKPRLADSSVIYKKTIDGFFVSRDGGKTYINGFDSSGNAVVNILSTIGINFDWAYGGTLTLGGDTNGHGVLNIVDKDGAPIVVGDNGGLTIYKGKISFSDVTDSDGNTLEDRISNASSSGGITKDQVTEITRNEIKSAKIGANQIYGNALTLGGAGNANGILVINDADGNAIVTGNKDGLVINRGTISWENVTGTDNIADKNYVKNAVTEAGSMTEDKVTQITKNTVTTSYVDALAITAKAVASDWIYAGNIKASQISGDTLTLGGNNNTNGQLVIKDVSGKTIVTGNKDGLKGDNFSIGADGNVSLKGDITANGKIEVSRDGLVATLSFESSDIEMIGGFSYTPGKVTATSVSRTNCKHFTIDAAEGLLLKLLAANYISSTSIAAESIAADNINFVKIGGNEVECDTLTVHGMVNTITVDATLNSEYFSNQGGSIRAYPFLGMVVWHKAFTLGEDLPANTNIQVGTINAAYAPVQMVYLSAGIGLTPTILFVKADGTITVCVAAKRSAGDYLRVSGCYFY